jgi:hypothetical protein
MSKTINPITPEEKDRIDKVKEKNDKMEEFFLDKRAQWNKNSEEIYSIVSIDLSATSSAKDVFEAQAKALTLRQQISDSINYFINKRSRENSSLKKLVQEKNIFYMIGFPVKTSVKEMTALIDGHIAENQRTIEIIDSYIEFLRDTSKNLESFGFSIKNRIELMNYLGK